MSGTPASSGLDSANPRPDLIDRGRAFLESRPAVTQSTLLPALRLAGRVAVGVVAGVVTYPLVTAAGLAEPWRAALTSTAAVATALSWWIVGLQRRLPGSVVLSQRPTGPRQRPERNTAEVQMGDNEVAAPVVADTEPPTHLESGGTADQAELTRRVALLYGRLRVTQPDSLVSRLVDDEVGRIAGFLRDVSEGVVRYDGEDRDWLLTLAQHTRMSIDATSLATVDARGTAFDGSFWQSDLGQRYLRIQRDLTRRGVEIRRIFVIDTPTVRLDQTFYHDFLTMCRIQASMQIEVRILEAPAGSRHDSRFDFVLFDNSVVYETTPQYAGEATLSRILRTQLELRPSVVIQRVNEFRELWKSATPLDQL